MTKIKRITGLLALLAVMLCVATFLLPVAVYAASDEDTVPPTLTATLNADTLHVEAADELSGVQAVFVDGTRINTLTNGKADVLLKDYAGNGKQVSVYAVDYAGNRSETVKMDNPYYTEPAPLPAASEPAPPASSQAPTAPPPASSTPAPPVSSTLPPASASEDDSANGSESAIPDGSTVLTPEGTGTVTGVATSEDDKLFYTIQTPAGNVFYLVVDLQRTDGGNVYFLNAVTEVDLAALAETDGGTTGGESAIPTPNPQPTPEPQPQPEPQPDPEPASQPEPEETGGGMGTIFLVFLAVAAVGGAGWYFKIYKPRKNAEQSDEMDEPDEEEPEFEGVNADDEDDLSSEDDESEDEAEAYQTSDGFENDEE